jgi:transposase
MHYPGVDVSRASLDLDDGEGRHRSFPNSPAGVARLASWLGRSFPSGDAQVVLEPTSTYHHLLVSELAASGIPAAKDYV